MSHPSTENSKTSASEPDKDSLMALEVLMKIRSDSVTSSPGAAKKTKAKEIRRDKIEAALRSKPQRGKKRENLSVLERMELTRTRNREHAKTTRERKKARYQELLVCEEELQQYKKKEQLSVERSKEIQHVLSILESTLSSKTVAPSLNHLKFQASRHGAKESLAEFSEFLKANFLPLGSSMKFTMDPSMLAISESNGFCPVSLFVKASDGREVLVMTSILRVTFQGTKLDQLEWTVADIQSLGGQTSFPSVVSLDVPGVASTAANTTTALATASTGPATAAPTAAAGEEKDGPGMNI